MKKKFLFIALSLTLIFSYAALPSFADSLTSVVDMTSAVSTEEQTINQTNVEVLPGYSYDFLFNVNSSRFSLNNANSIILDLTCRDTIQLANTGSTLSPFGYVDIRAELHFADGSVSYSNWVTVECENNNPYSPELPRWSLQDENADFQFVFDVRTKSATRLVSVVTYQVFHPMGSSTSWSWSFWMRSQITGLNVVYNGVSEIIGAVQDGSDQITGAIQDGVDDIINYEDSAASESIDNVTNSEAQLKDTVSDLQGLVSAPDTKLDNLSSLNASFRVLSTCTNSIFTSLGGQFRSVWNTLVFFAGMALLLNLAVNIHGLSQRQKKSDAAKARKKDDS